MSVFLDTSALVKLVVQEPETGALRGYLRERAELRRVASALARTELRRTLMRLGLPDAADALLEDLVLVRLDDSLLDAAGTLGGPVLRSLDAIHLACAMRVPALTAVVTYDVRMQQAAQALGCRSWLRGPLRRPCPPTRVLDSSSAAGGSSSPRATRR